VESAQSTFKRYCHSMKSAEFLGSDAHDRWRDEMDAATALFIAKSRRLASWTVWPWVSKAEVERALTPITGDGGPNAVA
jgi:hypothetical protein